jgi:hypothetical protein
MNASRDELHPCDRCQQGRSLHLGFGGKIENKKIKNLWVIFFLGSW